MIAITMQTATGLCRTSKTATKLVNRSFISHAMQQWLMPFFNQVDYSRIKEVGPDRACAEWLH